MDQELRDAQRDSYENDRYAMAKLLQLRLRAGLLPQEYIVGAGLLGHRAAQLVIHTHTRDWTQQHERAAIYDYILQTNPHYVIKILLEYVEQEMLNDPALVSTNDTIRAEIIRDAPNIIREYLSIRDRVDAEPRMRRDVSPTAALWGVLQTFRGTCYAFNSHTTCISVGNILSLIQMLEDVRVQQLEHRSRTSAGRHLASGAASVIRPCSGNKENYRYQALFIAERLLGLAALRGSGGP